MSKGITKINLISWIIAFSPLIAISILFAISLTKLNCNVTEASFQPCIFIGFDIGPFLGNMLLFAAWGWIISVPLGVIVDFTIKQFTKRHHLHTINNQVTPERQISGKSETKLCVFCRFEGTMKLWLRNYNQPQFLTLLLLLLWIIPGLIFLAWSRDKFMCPNCGKVGKMLQPNQSLKNGASQSGAP